MAACPGCGGRAAPSLSLFGAYFPVWLLAGVAGIAGALAAWRVILALGLSARVPAMRMTCSAIGLIVACVAWWCWG